MAVGKGKSAGNIVVTRRKIVEAGFRRAVRPAAHVGGEIAYVDAVLAHVEQDEGAGGTGIEKMGGLKKTPPHAAIRQTGVLTAETADPHVHGHTAHTRHVLSCERSIRGFDR